MHGLRLVHGDLKGVRGDLQPDIYVPLTFPIKANILINKDRRACISDFDLSTVTGVRTRATASASLSSFLSDDTVMSFTPGGTGRWMSPELIDPERFGIQGSEGYRPTRQSDCYALGMVIYEVSPPADGSGVAGIKNSARCYAVISRTTTFRTRSLS